MNNTKSQAHGLKPNEVNPKTEGLVFDRLFKPLPRRTRPQFKFGDQVRISVQKIIFAKEAQHSFSTEIFEIHKVILGRPTVYKLKDLQGEEIQGIFYASELVQVPQHVQATSKKE